MYKDNSKPLPQGIICFQIFIFVWFVAVLGINQNELQAYRVQRSMIDTMIKEGSFILGEQKPDSPPPIGDLVVWKDNILPFKQPGIGLVGSIPLRVYSLFKDLNGTSEYAFIAAFTSSLAVAFISSLMFILLEMEGYSRGSSVFSALVAGTGTVLSAYSGTIHHDPITAAIVFAGYYLLQLRLTKNNLIWVAVAGFLLAFSTFLSLQQVGIVVTLTIWKLLLAPSCKYRAMLISGISLGLIPILIYHWYYFDSPFRTASHVYSISHKTILIANMEIFIARLSAYFSPNGAVRLYVFIPACIIGTLGLVYAAVNRLKSDALLLLGLIFAHLAYISVIGGNTGSPSGFGDCQFGPRYWIVASPFMCMGLAPILRDSTKIRYGKLLRYCIYAIALWSIFVNQVGLHLGTMYCGDGNLTSQLHHYNERFQKIDPWNTLQLPYLSLAQAIVLLSTVIIQAFLRLQRRNEPKKQRENSPL